uniref:Uncharacterized protein n=1 Tax=Acrobeloides nanus TaxID=290746 RepID=A0A914CKV6_9BILA
MFYSYDLLLQRNKNFAIIWRVVHQPKKNFSRKEIIPVNLEQACKELMQYIPSGMLNKSELEKKFSLYLLSQLMHGIVIIYSKKMYYIVKDLDEALKQLRPEIFFVKTEKSALRKRRSKTVDEIIDAEMGKVFTPKKRRSEARQRTIPTARIEDITLREDERTGKIDGVNAMTVFGQEDLAPMTAEDREMLDREISSAKLQPVDSSVLGTPAPRLTEKPEEMEIQFSPPKFSLEQEMARRESSMDRRLTEPPRQEALQELEFEAPPPSQKAQEESPKEQDSGLLLEALEVKAPPIKRRAHRKLVIDQETYIPNDRMAEQIRSYEDTMKPIEDRIIKIPKEPAIHKQLSLRPLRVLNKELLELFDIAALNVPMEKLTFQQAQNAPFTERFMRPGAILWSDEETTPQREAKEIGEKFSFAYFEPSLPKMSVAELALEPLLPRPSSVMEFARRQTEASAISGIVHPLDVQLLDEWEERRRESMPPPPFPPFEIDMMEPMQEPKMRSPIPFSPPCVGVTLIPSDLLQEIKKGPGEMVNFSDVIKAYDRNEAAKSFYNLLVLLKNREIKAKQDKPYSEIYIKITDKLL